MTIAVKHNSHQQESRVKKLCLLMVGFGIVLVQLFSNQLSLFYLFALQKTMMLKRSLGQKVKYMYFINDYLSAMYLLQLKVSHSNNQSFENLNNSRHQTVKLQKFESVLLLYKASKCINSYFIIILSSFSAKCTIIAKRIKRE